MIHCPINTKINDIYTTAIQCIIILKLLFFYFPSNPFYFESALLYLPMCYPFPTSSVILFQSPSGLSSFISSLKSSVIHILSDSVLIYQACMSKSFQLFFYYFLYGRFDVQLICNYVFPYSIHFLVFYFFISLMLYA